VHNYNYYVWIFNVLRSWRVTTEHKKFEIWSEKSVQMVDHQPFTVICHYSRFMSCDIAGLHRFQDDSCIGSGGRSEGAHPFSGPLSRRGLIVQLSSHTNQFGRIAGSNLQPAPLTVWECAHSPDVRAYTAMQSLPFFHTIPLPLLMSCLWKISRSGFPLPSLQSRIWSILLSWWLCFCFTGMVSAPHAKPTAST